MLDDFALLRAIKLFQSSYYLYVRSISYCQADKDYCMATLHMHTVSHNIKNIFQYYEI